MTQTRLLLTRDKNCDGHIFLWLPQNPVTMGEHGRWVGSEGDECGRCFIVESEEDCLRIAGFIPERGECVECKLIKETSK